MAQTTETSRNHRRASIALLDAARRAVPTCRLCPCGVPKEALGHRAPKRRMVPTLWRRTTLLQSQLGCRAVSDSEARSATVLTV
jgi:hypothetical protein